MAKYFVYRGFQFQTISVLRSEFNAFPEGSAIDAVSLESVTTALGTGVVANLAALQALWGSSGVTDKYQLFARQTVELNAPLITGQKTDIDDSSTMATLHQQSYRFILPMGLAEGFGENPTAAANADTARNRGLVAMLEVPHDNIKKHDTEAEAWTAWGAYEVGRTANEGLSLVSGDYLINVTA